MRVREEEEVVVVFFRWLTVQSEREHEVRAIEDFGFRNCTNPKEFLEPRNAFQRHRRTRTTINKRHQKSILSSKSIKQNVPTRTKLEGKQREKCRKIQNFKDKRIHTARNDVKFGISRREKNNESSNSESSTWFVAFSAATFPRRVVLEDPASRSPSSISNPGMESSSESSSEPKTESKSSNTWCPESGKRAVMKIIRTNILWKKKRDKKE